MYGFEMRLNCFKSVEARRNEPESPRCGKTTKVGSRERMVFRGSRYTVTVIPLQKHVGHLQATEISAKEARPPTLPN